MSNALFKIYDVGPTPSYMDVGYTYVFGPAHEIWKYSHYRGTKAQTVLRIRSHTSKYTILGLDEDSDQDLDTTLALTFKGDILRLCYEY